MAACLMVPAGFQAGLALRLASKENVLLRVPLAERYGLIEEHFRQVARAVLEDLDMINCDDVADTSLLRRMNSWNYTQLVLQLRRHVRLLLATPAQLAESRRI